MKKMKGTMKEGINAVKHVYNRHTLLGILEVGQITTDYRGNTVALFPLDTTFYDIYHMAIVIENSELEWKEVTHGKHKAIYNGLTILAHSHFSEMSISSFFPLNSVSRSYLKEILNRHISGKDMRAPKKTEPKTFNFRKQNKLERRSNPPRKDMRAPKKTELKIYNRFGKK